MKLTKQQLRQDLQGNPIDGAWAEVVLIGWVEPHFCVCKELKRALTNHRSLSTFRK